MARGSVASVWRSSDNRRIETRRDHFALALRASRSDPPGRAAEDSERHAIYGAALQQFDELLHASRLVGAASQPLLLFYALSQGGRAVVAARGDKPHLSSHGLREVRDIESETVLHRRVRRARTKNDSDAFGAVRRATLSPDFTGSVELGAVWAAIPSVHRLPTDCWREEWRLALDVHSGSLARQLDEGTNVLLMSFSGNPLVDGLSVFAEKRYPTLPPDTTGALRTSADLGAGNWYADVNLPSTHGDAVLDRVAPKIYGGNERALIPTLPGQRQVLSPLMLWWVLLFGLSIFARYHPALWAAALDVQHSKEAVPLEAVLEKAGDLLPALIYEAIFMG